VPFSLTRTRALALVIGAIAVVLLGERLFRSAPPQGTTPPILTGSAPAVAHTSAPAARLLVVDVAGDVRRPGLYRLPQGSRIQNAIVQAGGPTRGADLDLVNLAAPVADGEQVVVPGRGAAASASGVPSPTAPLDLNSATAEQLDGLPGIGPVTAQKIIDYRQAHGPFTSIDDLASIPGMGPAHIANLKGLVVP
jgi:competence protein ComEA